MAISVTCPDCQHTFSVRDEYAGKRGKCPRCNGVFRAVPNEADAAVGIPAVLAARSGVSLGPAPGSNGGVVVDASAPARPSEAGRKSSGKRKPSRREPAGPSMPVWGWITLGVIVAAGFVGAGLVYMTRNNNALAEVNKVKDGSDAAATKQELLDEIKAQEKRIAELESKLAAAEKKILSNPNEKDALGEIERRVIPGVVKVIPYVGDQPRQNTATGFLFEANGKVLIATSHRVCEGAGKIVVKLATGTEYDVEGMVAASQNQDIAILKPKGEMPGATPLTLAESAPLERGETVYAIGNPGKQEFTTSRGVITRVIAQDKYQEENPTFDIAMRRETAANPNYIEHDARIFPGDYGGPLLNDKLEVVGMNQLLVTMVMNDGRSIVQTFGAAKQTKEVKAVAAKASDTILPYPPAPKEEEKKEEPKDNQPAPPDDGEAQPDDGEKPEEPKDDDAPADEAPATDDLAGKIDALYGECEGFDWKPTTNDEYGKLCEIARRVTEAKLLEDDDEQKEAANTAADKVLKRLGEAKWESSDAEEVNKLALALEPAQDAGFCFVGTVRGQTTVNGASAIIFQIGDSDTVAIVASENASAVPAGTRGIVLGQFASGDKQKIKNQQDGKEFTAVMVKSKALIKLQ